MPVAQLTAKHGLVADDAAMASFFIGARERDRVVRNSSLLKVVEEAAISAFVSGKLVFYGAIPGESQDLCQISWPVCECVFACNEIIRRDRPALLDKKVRSEIGGEVVCFCKRQETQVIEPNAWIGERGGFEIHQPRLFAHDSVL